MKIKIFAFIMLVYCNTKAQDKMEDSNYYSQIPEPAEEYSPGAIVSRMIDGLGFRYYWATEGLTEKDLMYKPSKEGRSAEETLEHIFSLSTTILNSAKKQPTVTGVKKDKMSFAEKRAATLQNLKTASILFLRTEDISEHKIVFKRAKGNTELPFWNQINGPIEDAVWHAGQIVVLRRASGNPMSSKVNMLTGETRD